MRPSQGRRGARSRTIPSNSMTDPNRRTATVDEVLTALETARDRVMADEVKSLTKLGIPKTMAVQIVASRFRQRTGHEDEPDPFEATGSSWPELG